MDISQHKPEFDKTIDHLKAELSAIRTNRANPSLVENIMVKAYEGTEGLPLVQLASITVPEARQLMIEPWDKSTLKQIEKAITNTEMGLSITNEGSYIRLTMPLMTDEVKQQIIKILHTKLEDSRIATRALRDKIKEDIIKQEKDKTITEDDRYRLIEKLDDLVKEYNEKVKEMGEKKEKEIKG